MPEVVPDVVDVEIEPPQGHGHRRIAQDAVGERLVGDHRQTAHEGQGAHPQEGNEEEQLELQPHPAGEPGDGLVGPHLVPVPDDRPGGEGDARQGGDDQQPDHKGADLPEIIEQIGKAVIVSGKVLGGMFRRRQGDRYIGVCFRRESDLEAVGDLTPVLVNADRLPVVGQQKVVAIRKLVGPQLVGVGKADSITRRDHVEQVGVLRRHGIRPLRVGGAPHQNGEPVGEIAAEAVRGLVVCPEHILPGDHRAAGAGHGYNHHRRRGIDEQADAQHKGREGHGGLNAFRFCIQCPTPPSDTRAPSG